MLLVHFVREHIGKPTNKWRNIKVLQGLKHGNGELGFYCTDLQSDEERAYEAAIKADDILIFEDFLYEDKFTNSTFNNNITQLLKEKRILDAWKKIEKK
jgi:hypothetical protein